MFFCASLLLIYSSSLGQDESLSEGATILFKDIESRLTNSDKNQIFNASGFQLSKDKTQFHFNDGTAAEFPFNTLVFPLDLNGDGIEEVAIQYGNTFTSGMEGMSFYLFIKDKDGMYQSNLGFPGVLLLATTYHLDFPDILIGGAGFQPYPAYRWNGQRYDFFEKIERQVADEMPPVFVTQASNAYLESIQH